ncbi:MAG: DUF1499 domain-containing protein [Bacteriovoracaceae bacterium]|nr:DUF1499 domain-containing protein [Bacteriovoracaceae bacterium]
MRPILGIVNNQLTACSEKPNCVSSTSARDDSGHYLAATKVTSNPISIIREKAKSANLVIIDFRPNYLRFTITSPIFKFVDDIEFFYDSSLQELHYRSGSRVGYSDMGKNRSRLTEFLSSLKL